MNRSAVSNSAEVSVEMHLKSDELEVSDARASQLIMDLSGWDGRPQDSH